MADDEKKEAPSDKDVPSNLEPAPGAKVEQPWVAPAPGDVEEPEEVTAAHQAFVKAEQEYAQAVLKQKDSLDKARDNLNHARASAVGINIEDGKFPGYWHKTWAGHDCLQCGYCSWDVVTSSMYNYVERMQAHLLAAHPNWEQLPAVFDESGNFVEGGV